MISGAASPGEGPDRMCGIAGILAPNSADPTLAAAMGDRLQHRGPDDGAVWADGPVALAHRRLSILDLSPAGRQPMASRDGRWTLVFNGEIYNHLELRRELDGPWRGHSDTETVLAAISAWGVEATLKRLVGMFAIAAWNGQEQSLYLARDRMGEKPLYLGRWDGGLAFASEVKALRVLPGCCRSLDRTALASYLRHSYVPTAHCIWQGVRKLPPATWLCLRPGDDPLAARPTPYWSALEIAQRGESMPFTGSDDEAVAELDALLRRAVAGQMASDVPLGAFLSGGIDSSIVVALMQAQNRQPVRSFCIGFAESTYDESGYAAAVARHLGTDHTTLTVTAADALATIPRLARIWDEPFADPSQIPTLLLAGLTRRHVTVSLSGDGGDELFAGYPRYFKALRIWSYVGWMPASLRRIVSGAIRGTRPLWWRLSGPLTGVRYAGDRVLRVADVLGMPDFEACYQDLICHTRDPGRLLVDGAGGNDPPTACPLRSKLARMQWLDQIAYLPDDILVKVDRAAMAMSLETRVPLLDHRVVEFAARLPHRMRVRHGQGKWLLRQVLNRYVPRALIDRPKMGFGIPLGEWLRGPLRDWAEALLDERRLRSEGIFRPEPVRQLWDLHLSGQRDEPFRLWDILMFQEWWARWNSEAT